MMREALKNLHGSFLLTSARAFKIGDRIEIKNFRGEVIDTNFMTTKIAKINGNGSGSNLNGNITTLPNSIFLSSPVINESFNRNFVFHSFDHPIKEGKDWKKRESIFLEVTKKITSEYSEDALKYFKSIEDFEMVNKLELGPQIYYSTPSPERINMTIKMIIPTEKKDEVESRVFRDFYTALSVVEVTRIEPLTSTLPV